MGRLNVSCSAGSPNRRWSSASVPTRLKAVDSLAEKEGTLRLTNQEAAELVIRGWGGLGVAGVGGSSNKKGSQ